MMNPARQTIVQERAKTKWWWSSVRWLSLGTGFLPLINKIWCIDDQGHLWINLHFHEPFPNPNPGMVVKPTIGTMLPLQCDSLLGCLFLPLFFLVCKAINQGSDLLRILLARLATLTAQLTRDWDKRQRPSAHKLPWKHLRLVTQGHCFCWDWFH